IRMAGSLLAPGKKVLCLGALGIARSAVAQTKNARREIEIPKTARFVTADGAITGVGYNDMREKLEAIGAMFTPPHPEVRFAFDLRGTRFAPAALAAGTSAFAPMGGEFTPPQLEEYRAVVGDEPLAFRVAHASVNPRALSGPLGIFVHPHNP